MERFISQSQLHLSYSGSGDFFLSSFGYDDFTKVAPLKHPRVQTFYTLHYVISGKGTLMLNDQWFEVSAGSVFFLPPNETIMYYPDEELPWEYVWFAFNGEKSREYGEVIGFSLTEPICYPRDQKQIIGSLERLLGTALRQDNCYYLVQAVFFEIVHLCKNREINRGISEAKRLIEENCTSPNFTIDQLCESLSISHSHLCREFKKAYDCTVIQYIIEQRLKVATRLLRTTDLSVKTIALSCGYKDELHFMKSFKKTYGVSALAFRKNIDLK